MGRLHDEVQTILGPMRGRRLLALSMILFCHGTNIEAGVWAFAGVIELYHMYNTEVMYNTNMPNSGITNANRHPL